MGLEAHGDRIWTMPQEAIRGATPPVIRVPVDDERFTGAPSPGAE